MIEHNSDQLDAKQYISDARVYRTSRVANYFAVFAAVFGIGIGVYQASSAHTTPLPIDTRLIKVQADLNARIDALSSEVQRLISSTAALQHLPANSELAVQVKLLREDILKTQENISILNAAISATPEKALSVPLLRKDVDDFKDKYQHDLELTNRSVERVYDQNKWFMGLMLTMAMAVLGLAVSNILKKETPTRSS